MHGHRDILVLCNRGLDRNLNPRVPLYTTLQTFAGASGHIYIIKLKILRVPKYTFQKFAGAMAPVAPVLTRPLELISREPGIF